MSQPIVSEARVFNKPQFYYQKTAKVELSHWSLRPEKETPGRNFRER